MTARYMATNEDVPHSPASHSTLALVVFAWVTAAVAVFGSRFTPGDGDGWYERLEKPFFNPPSWAFGVVWTTLYVAMAVAAWLVWRHGASRRDVQVSTLLFGFQLALNAAWSPVFFGLESLSTGLIIILLLLVAVVTWYVFATRVDRRSRWLISPYIAWVAFAAVLNGSIWWLN